MSDSAFAPPIREYSNAKPLFLSEPVLTASTLESRASTLHSSPNQPVNQMERDTSFWRLLPVSFTDQFVHDPILERLFGGQNMETIRWNRKP
jgi:hypothetical protein